MITKRAGNVCFPAFVMRGWQRMESGLCEGYGTALRAI